MFGYVVELNYTKLASIPRWMQVHGWYYMYGIGDWIGKGYPYLNHLTLN